MVNTHLTGEHSRLGLSELLTALTERKAKQADWIIPSSHIKWHNGRMIISSDTSYPDDALEAINRLLVESHIATVHDTGIDLALTQLPPVHGHISSKFKIPRQYYDRMFTDTDLGLYDHTLNHWNKRTEANYLCRMYIDKDNGVGFIRAMLSDRYKTIDNYDCLMAALDAIKRSGVAVKFEDCAITDYNMYVRVVCPAIVAESEILLRKYLPNGYNSTGIMAGLVISNSEVGSGAFTISPRLVVLACRNGLVVKKDAMRKVHIGAQLDSGSAVKWSDRTQRTNAELITSQTTDAVTQFLSQEYLGKTIATIELANQPLKRPTPVAQAVIPTIGVPLEHQEDVLRYFFESGDLSAFGLSQAATFYAKECGDSELQMKLEESALEIMEAAINHDRL